MSVTIYSSDTKSLTSEEIRSWQNIPVAVAADLAPQEQLDIAIRPLCGPGYQPKLCGRAFTVLCEPPDFGAVLHAIDLVEPEDVLVIATSGPDDTAMIGDILGGRLRAVGCVGVICDGAVRDVATLASWSNFSVFSRFVNPRGPTGAEKGKVLHPVMIGTHKVCPGDLILGDDDGLIALSPASAREKLGDAQAKLLKEEQWVNGLAAGKSCAEVFGLKAPIRV